MCCCKVFSCGGYTKACSWTFDKKAIKKSTTNIKDINLQLHELEDLIRRSNTHEKKIIIIHMKCIVIVH